MRKVQKGIRIIPDQWEQASEICMKMNTNLSAVINQLIAQIIIQEKIPFSLSLTKQDEELLDRDLLEYGSKVRECEEVAVDKIDCVPNNGTHVDRGSSSDSMEQENVEENKTDDGDGFMDWASLDIFEK